MRTFIDSKGQIHRKNFDNEISVEKVIYFLDKALKTRGKRYITLSQANNILKKSGAFTIPELHSHFLKIMLENGEIAHAYKTEKKPRQWIIYHSKVNVKIQSNILKEKKPPKKKKNTTVIKNNFQSTPSAKFFDLPTKVVIITTILIIVLIGLYSYWNK